MNEELINKIDQVDEILASFEDHMHGKDGSNCTKARKLLIEIVEIIIKGNSVSERHKLPKGKI